MSALIVVTGASGGIGKSICEEALRRGWAVIALGRSISKLSAVFSGHTESERLQLLEYNPFDFTDRDIAELLPNLPDIFVNNAGVAQFGNIEDIDKLSDDEMLKLNLQVPIGFIRSLAPKMKQRGSGIIANISSVASVKTFPGCATYSASKSGLTAYTRSLREELRNSNVKCVEFYVGAVNTPLWDVESRRLHSDKMLHADNVAKAIVSTLQLNYELPISLEELVIRPVSGDL